LAIGHIQGTKIFWSVATVSLSLQQCKIWQQDD